MDDELHALRARAECAEQRVGELCCEVTQLSMEVTRLRTDAARAHDLVRAMTEILEDYQLIGMKEGLISDLISQGRKCAGYDHP